MEKWSPRRTWRRWCAIDEQVADPPDRDNLGRRRNRRGRRNRRLRNRRRELQDRQWMRDRAPGDARAKRGARPEREGGDGNHPRRTAAGPQYAGEETTVEIGDSTVIREYATINRGTAHSF